MALMMWVLVGMGEEEVEGRGKTGGNGGGGLREDRNSLSPAMEVRMHDKVCIRTCRADDHTCMYTCTFTYACM